MKRRVLIVATTVSLAVLGQGVAGAAPTPQYSVTCVAGVQTTVNWERAKLTKVTIHWVAPAGSATAYEDVVVPVSAHPPRGFVVTATATSSDGVNPSAAIVTFERTSGATDEVRASCT